MNIAEKSLRFLVEKWLGPTPTMRIRVVQSGRMGLHKRRYVRVEASAATGSRAIFLSARRRLVVCVSACDRAAGNDGLSACVRGPEGRRSIR